MAWHTRKYVVCSHAWLPAHLDNRARSFVIEGNLVKVTSMTISPNEETLVCSLENNQVRQRAALCG